MPMAIRLTLPLPPSVNAAYVNVVGRGRVSSKALTNWKKDAGWRLQSQPRAQFAGPFRVAIYIPENMPGDADNRVKPCLDLLVSHRVTPDDRFARSVLVERCEAVSHGECLIVVESAI